MIDLQIFNEQRAQDRERLGLTLQQFTDALVAAEEEMTRRGETPQQYYARLFADTSTVVIKAIRPVDPAPEAPAAPAPPTFANYREQQRYEVAEYEKGVWANVMRNKRWSDHEATVDGVNWHPIDTDDRGGVYLAKRRGQS